MIELKVRGLIDLQDQLRALGDELGVKTLAAAARKAFKPVLDAAKSMVPVDTGALRDAIKITVKKPKGGETAVVVGLRIGKGQGAGHARVAAAAFGEAQIDKVPPARRWHFIELGTAQLAPHPFLRPALDSNAQAVVDLLKDELVKGISRAQKKKGSPR